MAQGKKSFIAYTDWKDTFDALPDDKAGVLIKFIYAYVNDEHPKTDDVLIKAVFANIKHTLKRDLKKWEIQQKQRIDAAKKSVDVRKRNKDIANERLTSANQTLTDSVNVSVNDTVNGKVNKQIPTYQEFKDYSLKNSKDIDLEKLELKYKSWVANNWNDGNNKPIKNWKSKILNTIPFLKLEKSKLADDTDY